MNPYKVLQLEPGADKQAIKKAYFKLIRQYPPEKESEKFKEIREAYEYLQEEANLVDVQMVVQLPEEFTKPYYQVLEWMKEHEYDKAVALCERVLSIVDLLEFRILLGKAYILNDNSGKAVKLWEGLCIQHEDNTEYLEQLGDAYKARGWSKKAFQVYYTLYERKVENLSFYDKLMDIAVYQGERKFIHEISKRILDYYRSMEKHTREDAESMSSILYSISDYMSQMDYQWLLNHSDEILKVMTEVPTELKVYENTILHNYRDLLDIFEQDEGAETAIVGYREFISANEKSISAENQYQLMFVKVQMEEIKMQKDSLIHDIVIESSKFWYNMLLYKMVVDKGTSAELHMMQLLAANNYDDSSKYDTLLYMLNVLESISPSLQRIKEEYPVFRQAMGDYLDEMISCSSKDYLFRKYEKRYKKLMGYPSSARLTLSSRGEEEDYDSYENGTYRREGTKIGRNDPCPCGSGKKYKKCCGR